MSESTAEVRVGIDGLLESLAGNRLEDALACFSPDPDVALYGSEAQEVAIGPAAIRAFLADLLKRPGPRFRLTSEAVSVNGDVAWFTSEAFVELPLSGQVLPYRLSGVLVRRDGSWLWALFNGSEPAGQR